MSVRFVVAAAVAAVLLSGCKDVEPIPNTPTTLRIVSGTNQSADLATKLDSSLVVAAFDAANRPASGVQLTWTVSGGGSLSATSTITDASGRSSTSWTLSATPGSQIVTVASPQISGSSVAFVANNGATVTGVVSPAGGSPFANFSIAPRRASTISPSVAQTRAMSQRLSPDRIIVGFDNAALGVSAAGSSAYRSMATAQQTVARLQQSVTTLARSLPIANAEISPAMLAARVRVTDKTQLERVMSELRSSPGVAWVERDGVISIRDGAPRPISAEFLKRAEAMLSPASESATRSMVDAKFPNDPSFYAQLWPTAMLDLPKAWSVTTGSASVTVAVVDMGIRFEHSDIAANLTKDGYDFVSKVGYGATQNICSGGTFDTIDGDGDAADPDPTDPDDLFYDPNFDCWEHEELGDHGLWTAGIIGSVGNDGVGSAGVNWAVKIRPIRVLGITGDGTFFDIAQGILYAAGLPAAGPNNTPVQAPSRAQIINLSLGGPSSSSALQSAVNAAYAAGSLLVASAGNDGLDFPNYPAAYTNVMGVSSIGQDGGLATYSNAGTFISVAAPGGDYRLDDNGGGGILGPGWNFVANRSTYLFGYGTSAAAPYVSGVAALLLAQTPGLTPAQLRQRIEQFALRPSGVTRSDMFGWGIVNAYNSLTQSNGPTRATLVRLVDATTGVASRSTPLSVNGSFTFTKVASGAYYVQAGDDETGDATLGVPGRRFGWYGGFGAPKVVNVNGNSQSIAFTLGLPTEVEPNNDVGSANVLVPGSYVIGNITTPDERDIYSIIISAAGMYTFETSGLVGSCGLGVEMDTFLSLQSQAGAQLATNNDVQSATSRYCSRIQQQLTPGVYYITVTGSSANLMSPRGRYRLQVRAGN